MQTSDGMTRREAETLVASVPHWHHSFDIYPGVTTPGSYDPRFLFEMMELGSNLTGKRLLDIGASDGFFSREAHKLGAEVVSVDYRDRNQHGFGVMERI